MTTWQRVDISDEEVDFNEDNQQPGSNGLSTTPELLHADFNSDAHHLSDVQNQHKQVFKPFQSKKLDNLTKNRSVNLLGRNRAQST